MGDPWCGRPARYVRRRTSLSPPSNGDANALWPTDAPIETPLRTAAQTNVPSHSNCLTHPLPSRTGHPLARQNPTANEYTAFSLIDSSVPNWDVRRVYIPNRELMQAPLLPRRRLSLNRNKAEAMPRGKEASPYVV